MTEAAFYFTIKKRATPESNSKGGYTNIMACIVNSLVSSGSEEWEEITGSPTNPYPSGSYASTITIAKEAAYTSITNWLKISKYKKWKYTTVFINVQGSSSALGTAVFDLDAVTAFYNTFVSINNTNYTSFCFLPFYVGYSGNQTHGSSLFRIGWNSVSGSGIYLNAWSFFPSGSSGTADFHKLYGCV